MSVNILEVSAPEYDIRKTPDYVGIGRKVDEVIEKNFPDGKYILRAISSDDHDVLSLDELVDIILEGGTDKYDPEREGICYEEFCRYDYDIQAGMMEIKNRKIIIPGNYPYPTEFGDTVWRFYKKAPLDRGYAVRIDLLLIYDEKFMAKAEKFDPESESVKKEMSDYLYKFKDQRKKKEALLGVIKILR